MADQLVITLNGTERSFSDLGDTPSVANLIAQLGFRADRVANEHNGEIVPRAEWPNTTLESGDKLELVHFVGGGSNGLLA